MSVNIKDLPQDVQDQIHYVTSLDPNNMLDEDQRFLRARRAYLRPEQLQVYAGVLDGTIPPANVPEEKEEVVTKAVVGNKDETKQIDPDNYLKTQLVQMAKDAGVLPDGDPTKKELADALNAHWAQ